MISHQNRLVIFLLAISTSITTGGTHSRLANAQESDSKESASQADAAKKPENLPENINASFLDPEMKVEDYIKRFEIESREVFACQRQIVAETRIQPGMAIADIGAGTGLYLQAFSKAVGAKGTVYAVDISPKFVKHLRQRSKSESLANVEVTLCSDRDVNLKPSSIDRAFICDVYHHFEYPKLSLASIHRALRTGGELVVIDFERIEGKSREWLLGHIRAPKEVFQREIQQAGFELVQEVKIDGFEENYFLRFRKK